MHLAVIFVFWLQIKPMPVPVERVKFLEQINIHAMVSYVGSTGSSSVWKNPHGLTEVWRIV
jgi:hypothetical protein